MGDIVRKVKLCGLTRDGKLQRDWRKCPEIDALVDTGATATVVSRAVAKSAGATILPGAKRWRGRLRDGALLALRLDGPGCGPSAHIAVVDDRLAASAAPHADIILGHDYLQDNRARIDYESGSVVNCPPRKPRNGQGNGRK